MGLGEEQKESQHGRRGGEKVRGGLGRGKVKEVGSGQTLPVLIATGKGLDFLLCWKAIGE